MGRINIRQENAKRARSFILLAAKNSLRMKATESVQHRNMKYFISSYATERGIEYATEARFKGGVADVVIMPWGLCLEVLGSEKLSRFEKKQYPFPTIPVPAFMPLNEVLAILDDLDAMNGDGWLFHRERITKQILDGRYKGMKENKSLSEVVHA